jgi:hypothetical protein
VPRKDENTAVLMRGRESLVDRDRRSKLSWITPWILELQYVEFIEF